MSEFLEICELAARAGGDVLLDWQHRFKATEKGPKDLVTEADLASQKAISEVVLGRFPQHQFLGEETDASSHDQDLAASKSDYRWIVDPLDGTTNYVHHLPNFAVSIALEKAGILVAGVVYDPVLQECFSAQAGEGAYLNGQPIRVSDCQEMRQALLAASFSPNVVRGSIEVARFIGVLEECQAIRRLGSCALNLCYLASGRLDGYWATSVKIWDVAAGVLIVREAGGIITALNGGDLNIEKPQFVAAASGQLHLSLSRSLLQAEEGSTDGSGGK